MWLVPGTSAIGSIDKILHMQHKTENRLRGESR